MNTFRTKSVLKLRAIALILLIFLTLNIQSNVIYAQGGTIATTGTVFRDYNNNGTYDNSATFVEPGVSGVTITAYALDGSVAATATSDADGQYSIDIPDSLTGQRIRIEFTTIPSDLLPGRHNSADVDGAGTTLRFITVGTDTTKVDLALMSSDEYCSSDPELITSCYVIGSQNRNDTTIVGFSYSGGGYTPFLTDTETGSIYGIGYHRQTNTAFMGSFMKRHAGTAPNTGIGGLSALYVYRIDQDSLTTIDLTATFGLDFGTDNRVTGWNFIREKIDPTIDPTSTTSNFDNVGKNGMGDVEVSPDGTRLFVTNLFTRQIHIFDLAYNASSVTATGGYTASSAPVMSLNSSIGPLDPGCTNGIARPFGLGYHDGEIFSGWICTAENGGTSADLSAHVFRGNTLVFSMDLDFPRDCSARNNEVNCAGYYDGQWNPWASIYTIADGELITSTIVGDSETQPILSDIEFDTDGDMILGFRDRHGDQIGYNSFSNPNDNVRRHFSFSAGDSYRVCFVSGTYVLEGDVSGDCPRPAAGNGTLGPNNGQYYFDDDGPFSFAQANRTHGETFQGALVQVPGYVEHVSAIMDPTDYYTGGFAWVNNQTGLRSRTNALFSTGFPPSSSSVTFGKANGLGDIEALCPPPPLEIGNLVWIEDVRNGIQGTGVESSTAGVLLELVDPVSGSVIATTTTDSTGHYYFNEGSTWLITTPFWDSNGNGTQDPLEMAGIMPNVKYTVRVATSNFDPGGVLEGYEPTVINAASATTLNDSEGVSATITTGSFGDNNHTVDFGFVRSRDFGDLPDSFRTTLARDGASHFIDNNLYLGAGVDNELEGQPNALATGDGSDENGVSIPPLVPCQTVTITVTATNNTGSDAFLQGWLDLNGNGVFDIGEQIATDILVPNGTTNGTFNINVSLPCNLPTDVPIYSRFRLSTSKGLDYFGSAADGEVEDYLYAPNPIVLANVSAGSTIIFDYGDAPDSYRTSNATDGARHVVVDGLFLGRSVDREGDEQQASIGAVADGEDEDGVIFPLLFPGQLANIVVLANNRRPADAYLQGWFDFDASGTFTPDEQIALNMVIPAGTVDGSFIISFRIPANIPLNRPIYVRFRLSTIFGLDFWGAAPDGEVEDYLATFVGSLPASGETPLWREHLDRIIYGLIGLGLLIGWLYLRLIIDRSRKHRA